MYKTGILDKQLGLRKDATETIVAGKVGIFFGPWWMGYWPLPDAWKMDPKADWQAYSLLDAGGVFNVHMPTPTTSFCVVRKGYEHPEAAMKILNINNRDEYKFDLTKGGLSNELLRMIFAPYDELSFTAKAVKQVLAGTKKASDFEGAEYSLYPHLKEDTKDITTVKGNPVDMLGIQYWNQTAKPDSFKRLYSIMVGDAPFYDDKIKKNPVYSLTYSQTNTMQTRWANLDKLEDQTFMKIIMGAAPVSSFDKFVKDWKAQGGDKIIKEVAAESAK
jgi:putative aldouronate transport system substrate-binding protein